MNSVKAALAIELKNKFAHMENVPGHSDHEIHYKSETPTSCTIGVCDADGDEAQVFVISITEKRHA